MNAKQTLNFNATLFAKNQTIIVGLSGGPDSVCLLHLLHSYQSRYTIQLIAAHMNHGWRAESSADEQMCRTLCTQLAIPLHVAHLSEYAPIKSSGSPEADARTARQTFFRDIVHKYNADHIALGHHLDDHLETFFIRLMRGSSIHGLTGIKAKQGVYIRPLLQSRKQDILAYLQQHNLPYVNDRSNTDNRFLRNKIRNQLLPLLYHIEPRSQKTMVKTIHQLTQAQEALMLYAQQSYKQIWNANDGYKIQDFLQLPISIQHQLLMEEFITLKSTLTLSEKLFSEILRFLKTSKAPDHAIGTNLVVHKNTDFFWIKRSINSRQIP